MPGALKAPCCSSPALSALQKPQIIPRPLAQRPQPAAAGQHPSQKKAWDVGSALQQRLLRTAAMISFILLQNRAGKTRLAKYYVPVSDSEKRKLEYDVHRLIVGRDPKHTNFVEVRAALLRRCSLRAAAPLSQARAARSPNRSACCRRRSVRTTGSRSDAARLRLSGAVRLAQRRALLRSAFVPQLAACASPPLPSLNLQL